MKLFRRILVPHDFSEHSTRALRVAAELAREHGGRLLVLHVIVPFYPASGLPEQPLAWVPDAQIVGGERRHLQALVARTVKGRKAPRVDCRVEIGDPFRQITDAARGVDSIVIATAGRTGFSHLLIGSVAEKVVRYSPVPVVTIRPAATRARRRRAARRQKRARAARRR
jgi:nucleotide-binding universal stress UspA family protein